MPGPCPDQLASSCGWPGPVLQPRRRPQQCGLLRLFSCAESRGVLWWSPPHPGSSGLGWEHMECRQAYPGTLTKLNHLRFSLPPAGPLGSARTQPPGGLLRGGARWEPSPTGDGHAVGCAPEMSPCHLVAGCLGPGAGLSAVRLSRLPWLYSVPPGRASHAGLSLRLGGPLPCMSAAAGPSTLEPVPLARGSDLSEESCQLSDCEAGTGAWGVGRAATLPLSQAPFSRL